MLAFDLEPTSATRRFEPVIARCAYVWAAYAVVEFLVTSLAPLLHSEGAILAPWHWRLSGVLLAMYLALAGLTAAALGFVFSPFRTADGEDRIAAAAALVVISLFTMSALAGGEIGRSVYPALAVAAAQSVALTAALVRPGTVRLRWLSNPWFGSVVLLGPLWLNFGLLARSEWPIKAAADALLIALAAGAAARAPSFRPRTILALTAGASLACAGLAFWLGSQSLPWPAVSSVGRSESPDVILIVQDTVRADHLSVYGYPRKTTPVLESVAARATLFRRCMSTSDFTLPSHASMFTGLYPSWHGAHSGSGRPAPLSGHFVTIAEALAARGYRTAGVSANHAFFGREFGLDQGFQFMDARRPLPVLPRFPAIRRLLRRILNRVVSTNEFDLQHRRADEVNTAVMRVMASLTAGAPNRAPFFLFVNYMDAHAPYGPPAPFDSLFPGRARSWTRLENDRALAEINRTGRPATAEELRCQTALYDGGVAHTDARIGELVAHLKRLGVYESSLIVFTSDHGEGFGERGLGEHAGVSVYQELVHVPLIVKFPWQSRGKAVDTAVSVADIAPTVLRHAGAPILRRRHGVDLDQSARGEPRGAVFAESYPFSRPGARFRRVERAVVDRDWKYITSTIGKRELYNLALDPRERTNRYRPGHAEAGALTERINALVRDAPVFRRRQLSPETLESLRSLGYVQ